MLYFSSFLKTDFQNSASMQNLFAALEANGVKYDLLPNTRDIWMRDFMPVRRKDGKYISFRYEPTYLNLAFQLRTNFRKDISGQFWTFDPDYDNVIYSDINLDGGNMVFSPSRETVIISERVFTENPHCERNELIQQLEELLVAKVILIPALPPAEDMTGHADGMVRFVDEHTVLGNDVPEENGLEQEIKKVLEQHKIRVIDFPYYSSSGLSAEGCYLNYLETYGHIFLPIFGNDMDQKAIQMANEVFSKQVVPVRINEMPKEAAASTVSVGRSTPGIQWNSGNVNFLSLPARSAGTRPWGWAVSAPAAAGNSTVQKRTTSFPAPTERLQENIDLCTWQPLSD